MLREKLTQEQYEVTQKNGTEKTFLKMNIGMNTEKEFMLILPRESHYFVLPINMNLVVAGQVF